MVSFLRHIRSGIDAGILFEIVDKMRLIEIAAACRHIYPGKIRTGANLLQDLLKAADASKELGSNPTSWEKSWIKRRELMPM